MSQGSFQFLSVTSEFQPIACGERPERRFRDFGAGALSDTELLAVILRVGTKARDIAALSSRLIAEAGSLEALLSWQAEDFRRIKGIGPAMADHLVAIGEAARRLAKGSARESPKIQGGTDVLRHLRPEMMGLAVEKFWVFCLNQKFRLLKLVEVSSGSATSTLAPPRDIFREAIRHSATCILCAHNHPSGDPAPSSADIAITRQLREAARYLDIGLIDHVVVGDKAADPTGRGFFSFREAGLL